MADVLERAREAVREARLLDWVHDVQFEVAEHHAGEPAVFVTVLMRDERAEIVGDGEALIATMRRMAPRALPPGLGRGLSVKLAHDLLDQSLHLATKEPRRPRQASLRRAISSAYYGVFHLLAWEVARLVTRDSHGRTLRAVARRALQHSGLDAAARAFAAAKPGAVAAHPWLKALGRAPSAELHGFALAFSELHSLRHAADYDLARAFTRSDALNALGIARRAVTN